MNTDFDQRLARGILIVLAMLSFLDWGTNWLAIFENGTFNYTKFWVRPVAEMFIMIAGVLACYPNRIVRPFTIVTVLIFSVWWIASMGDAYTHYSDSPVLWSNVVDSFGFGLARLILLLAAIWLLTSTKIKRSARPAFAALLLIGFFVSAYSFAPAMRSIAHLGTQVELMQVVLLGVVASTCSYLCWRS